MKRFEAVYDCGVCYSVNLITADRYEDACEYAENHATMYGYDGVKVTEITESRFSEYSAKGMPSTSFETVREYIASVHSEEIADTVNTADLAENVNLGDYADRLNDYRNSDGYICDIIAEIADSATSIYYSDILAFISKNPEALADVISEGLYDPSTEYDLYKHAQAAEYMLIERDLYDHLEAALLVCAADLLHYDLERDTIPADLADSIRAWCEDADSNARMSDLADLINDYFEEVEA